MSIESEIGFHDELPIESSFPSAWLVTRCEHNRPTLWSESKSHAPDAIGRVKSKFFHISLPCSFQHINSCPAQQRSELLEQARVPENLIPDLVGQVVELELIARPDNPRHLQICTIVHYAVKCIKRCWSNLALSPQSWRRVVTQRAIPKKYIKSVRLASCAR
jgi:hypothetical protein